MQKGIKKNQISKIDRELEIQRIIKHLENMITHKKIGAGDSTNRSGFDSINNTGNETRRVERDQIHERIVRRIDQMFEMRYQYNPSMHYNYI